MNLKILLLNTLTITATKVQTVINEFMQDDFCTNIIQIMPKAFILGWIYALSSL